MKTNLLRAARVKLECSTDEMGKAINKCRSSYVKKENGEVAFTCSEIVTVAKRLLLTIEDVNDIFFDSNLPFRKYDSGFLPKEVCITRSNIE